MVAGRAESGGAVDPVGNGATGTNVQEQGVDEPDLAKTNGTIAVVVDEGQLEVSDVTGAEPRRLGRLDTDARTAGEILLVGDRVVMIGNEPSVAQPDTARPDTARPDARPGIVPGECGHRTVLTTVDVSDPTVPKVVDKQSVDGSYVTAREHTGTVRIVVGSQPDLEFVHPGKSLSPDQAERKNRKIVRETTATDWLPSAHSPDGADEPLLKCSDFRRPRDPSGLGMTTALTLDPDKPALPEADAVIADGSLVYASADRLYVATMAGGSWEGTGGDAVRAGGDRRTQVHAFDTEGDDTSYEASGRVEGTVPDRWAMSEYEGRLRIASIRGDPSNPSETRVSVLDEDGDRLEVLGSVGGMGETEQIRAVRWFGDTAVVMTFRQTDPLYTLDLADPANPRILGELKIPGFSEYLHPVGDDLLLGVGQDATMSGRQKGSQVSSFDLSDLSAPSRVDSLALGDRSYSSVQQDSRAFTYLPDRRLMFVPVRDSRGTSPRVFVARVGTNGALTPIKKLTVPGSLQQVRVLPIDDGRLAVVADGAVQQIVDPGRW